MHWNIIAEGIAALIVIVILLNSRYTHAMPSFKERLFRSLLVYSLFSFIINIFSAWSVSHYQELSRFVIHLINTLYFLFYPFIAQFFIYYIFSYVYEYAPPQHRKRRTYLITFILLTSALYLVVVALNHKTGSLYYLDATNLYHRGPLNSLPIIISVIHIIAATVGALLEIKYFDKYFIQIISWPPLAALIIVVVQMFYPDTILTGTAFVIVALSFYLNFQTSRISIDSLTRYPNRDTFNGHVELLTRKKKKSTILIISIDNFNQIAYTFGNQFSNLLIKGVAEVLSTLLPKGQVYRYQRDELAIIVPKNGDSEIANKIIKLFEKPFKTNSISTVLRASVALLNLPFDYKSETDAITLLDNSIATAKTLTQKRLVVADAAMISSIRRKNKIIETLLNRNFERNLYLVYQPIFSLKDGSMVEVEALIRMENEHLGLVGPNEFIPLAEELGIVSEIGKWVLTKSLTLLSTLKAKNLKEITISINFSAQQFEEPDISFTIINQIKEANVGKGRINFELTESSFLDNSFDKAKEVCEQLYAFGSKFHLDDFGSGYSNLSYLVKLPFQFIKLDKTLLWEIEDDQRRYRFLDSIVKIAQKIDYEIIVEGVENEKQLAFLLSSGAAMAQGYYLSEPLSATQLIEKIENGPISISHLLNQ